MYIYIYIYIYIYQRISKQQSCHCICISVCNYVSTCRYVWRGLKNIFLPEQFLTNNSWNFRGGVERSMMSTSTSKEVAVQVSLHGWVFWLAYMDVCYAHILLCVCVCVYVFWDVCVHTQTCVHLRMLSMHVCILGCMCILGATYIYIYIYIYMDAYSHTLMYVKFTYIHGLMFTQIYVCLREY
jgi:hypothetical protein